MHEKAEKTAEKSGLMTDVHSPEVRSYNMSRIRNKDTKPELILRKGLYHAGFRYTKNDNRLPGKPDIVLRKYKALIFIHGCFWHQHDCHLFRLPKTRTEFWEKKISGNVVNDRNNAALLSALGWRVCIVWECALKGKHKIDNRLLL